MAQKVCLVYRFLILIGTASLLAACSAFSAPTQPAIPGIEETLVMVAALETLRAQPTQTLPPTETFTPSPTYTHTPSYTPTETRTPTITQTPSHTPTFTETLTPTVTLTPTITPSVTRDPTIEAQFLQEQIAGAQILVYEDVIAESSLLPRLDTALSDMGYTSDNFYNARDAAGNFSRMLNSQDWDLVIVSAEMRPEPRTGIITEVMGHINRKGAVIFEAWNLNRVGSGQISFVLERCGVQVQGDWSRPDPPYEPTEYYLFALDPYSMLFFEPNRLNFPMHQNIYWMGDGGDLLKTISGSDARLLVGLYADDTSRNGVVATCLEGRMIVQTFSTHDYGLLDTTRLWQNYIDYTLTNHFIALRDAP